MTRLRRTAIAYDTPDADFPQSWNRYSHVGNNPLRNPLGSWEAGQDPQLAAAVKTLLEQLGPENKGKIAAAGTGRR